MLKVERATKRHDEDNKSFYDEWDKCACYWNRSKYEASQFSDVKGKVDDWVMLLDLSTNYHVWFTEKMSFILNI